MWLVMLILAAITLLVLSRGQVVMVRKQPRGPSKLAQTGTIEHSKNAQKYNSGSWKIRAAIYNATNALQRSYSSDCHICLWARNPANVL